MIRPADEAETPYSLEEKDITFGVRLAAWRDHPFVRGLGKIGQIGDQGPLYFMGTATIALGLLRHRPRLAATGISVVAAVAMADLSKTVVKKNVTRTRPAELLDHGKYEIRARGSEEKPKQSFPSGHTACSIAAARAVSRSHPQAGAACMVVASIIGFSRLLKGAHWPLDLAAGIAIGLAAEAVSHRIFPLPRAK